MWDKLKKMVFVQEEEQSTPSSVVKPTVSVPTPSLSYPPSLSYQDNTLSQPSFNPEIEKHFMDILDQANLPGPDYYEFKKAINNSISTMPEQILFQTTFNTLSTLGMTKDIVLKSIEEYHKVLDADKVAFDKVILDTTTLEITQKEEQYKRNVDEINKLQQKVLELNQLNGNIQNEIMQSQNTINKNIAGYNQGYTAMKQTLESDKQKINTYI